MLLLHQSAYVLLFIYLYIYLYIYLNISASAGIGRQLLLTRVLKLEARVELSSIDIIS